MCCMCGTGSPICRFRCLKCCGSFLFIIGVIFIAGGVVFALSETSLALFHFLSAFNYSYISLWGGIGALVAGIAAIYVGFRDNSDDDCSPRGMAVMCILAILSTAGTMAVLTYNLYVNHYFESFPDNRIFLSIYVTENTPATNFDFQHQDWLASIIIYGSMCFMTLIGWAASLSAIAIGCCCPDSSEFVDEKA